MTRRHSRRFSADVAATAKWLVMHRGLLQHQAAARLDINQGRVSEVMTGKRFPGIHPEDRLGIGP